MPWLSNHLHCNILQFASNSCVGRDRSGHHVGMEGGTKAVCNWWKSQIAINVIDNNMLTVRQREWERERQRKIERVRDLHLVGLSQDSLWLFWLINIGDTNQNMSQTVATPQKFLESVLLPGANCQHV